MNTLETVDAFVSVMSQICEYLKEGHGHSSALAADEDLQHRISELIDTAAEGRDLVLKEFFVDDPDHTHRKAFYTHEAAMTLFQFALLEGCSSNQKEEDGNMITVLTACATCSDSHSFICQLRLPYMPKQFFFESILKLGFFLAKNAQKFSALPHDCYLSE